MIERFAFLLERRFNIPPALTQKLLQRLVVGMAGGIFVLISTIIVSLNVFSLNNIQSLKVGDRAPQDIAAPDSPRFFVSDELTEQARQEARESVAPIYDPSDANVARQQTQLARQILDFIGNVRRDSFATEEQKSDDLHQITALTLDDAVIRLMIRLDENSWKAIDDEIINTLTRVMREFIRPSDLATVRSQLPNQIAVRFNPQENTLITAIVDDLLRANAFENPEKTEQARQAAADAVIEVQRSFERGQMILYSNDLIDELDYEALQKLGLLTPGDQRLQIIGRALLASIVVMVVIGLYVARFDPHLIYREPRFLMLLAGLFLLMLLAVRLLGVNSGQIYLFPISAMALVYVSITGPRVALIAALGMALLVGLMSANSLEIATLVAFGGIIGALLLRRPERFNNFFMAGFMIALMNTAVIALFRLGLPGEIDSVGPIVFGLVNGALLVPTTAFGLMYLVTVVFNLPTPFKLIDLSQPNKPLLQRLLREAPGTYQHSLQVANLAEQAANAIGADSQLTHVAALYHDIGKMVEPVFFSENQQHIANPHDTLNDPYRSASVIIGHVTEGEEMARQYRLPNRLRDFIREHHGTTQVYVFYQRAIQAAGGDPSAVDIADFTYPGPKPRSRETAILMMADGCESAVRAMKPENRQAIREVVHNIIEDKRKAGQLDESGLTLNDLKKIENIFIDLLQSIYHPRINYQEAISKSRSASRMDTPSRPTPVYKGESRAGKTAGSDREGEAAQPAPASRARKTTTEHLPVVKVPEEQMPTVTENDDAPLLEVPPLPRSTKRTNNGEANGISAVPEKETPAEKPDEEVKEE